MDVHPRALSFFALLDDRGVIDLNAALRPLGWTRTRIESSRERLDWDTWMALSDAVAAQFDTTDALTSLVPLIYESELPGPLRVLSRAVADPYLGYRVGFDLVANHLYRVPRFSCRRLGAHRFDVVVSIPPERRGSFVWMTNLREAVRLFPVPLGLPPSVVQTVSMSAHRLHMRVTPPRPRSWLARARWAAGALRSASATLDTLEAHQAELRDAYDGVRARELSFQRVLESLPIPVGLLDADTFVWTNPAFEAAVGRRLVGEPADALIAAPSRAHWNALVEGESTRAVVQVIDDAGGVRALHVEMHGEADFLGHSARLVSARADIAAGEVLQELERARATIDALRVSMHDYVLLLDRRGRLTEVVAGPKHADADAALRPLIGQNILDVTQAFVSVEPGSLVRLAVDSLFDTLQERRPAQRSFPLRIDGQQSWFQVSMSPLDRDSGVALSVRDVTSEMAAEQELAVHERMATVGTLSQSIAHELNNPLTYLEANLELLLCDLKDLRRGEPVDVEALQTMVRDALDGTERMRKVAADLKHLAPGVGQAEHADLHERIHAAVRILEFEIRSRAALHLDLAAVPRVSLARHDVTQLLLSLVRQALVRIDDAGGSGELGNLSITCTPQRKAVRLVVEDDGVPMDPDSQLDALMPLWSSQRHPQGFGLAMCQRLVERAGGSLSVDSPRGSGTRVELRLPVRRSDSSAADADAGAIVVLIDDETLIHRLLERALDDFRVRAFERGADALDVLLDPEVHVTAVVCDLMMPSMPGTQVLQTLVERRPELIPKVIVITGGAISMADEDFFRSHDIPVLLKPFKTAVLRGAIQRASKR